MLKRLISLLLVLIGSHAFKITKIGKQIAKAGAIASVFVGVGMNSAALPALAAPVKPDFSKETNTADKISIGPVEITGTIILDNGVKAPETLSKALYITVKPDLGVVNSQILLRKFPAIMTKRVEGNIDFPYQYTISETKDFTEDVNLKHDQWASGTLPLLVSVRYDTDGSAATRDDTDLVGKGISEFDKDANKFKSADVVLEDRGIGGRLVTGRK